VADNLITSPPDFSSTGNWLLVGFLAALLALILLQHKKTQGASSRRPGRGYLLFLLYALRCAPGIVHRFSRSAFAPPGGALGLAERFEGRPLRVAIVSLYALYFLPAAMPITASRRNVFIWRTHPPVFEAEGVWLRANTPPDAKILVENLEVGYFAKRHTSDWPGWFPRKSLNWSRPIRTSISSRSPTACIWTYVGVHEGATDGYNTHVPANFKLVATLGPQRPARS